MEQTESYSQRKWGSSGKDGETNEPRNTDRHSKAVNKSKDLTRRFIKDSFIIENIGLNPLQENQKNNHESWLNNSDGENQVSQVRNDKCSRSALEKFKKHETFNLIRLKQTAKLKTEEADRNEKTTITVTRFFKTDSKRPTLKLTFNY